MNEIENNKEEINQKSKNIILERNIKIIKEIKQIIKQNKKNPKEKIENLIISYFNENNIKNPKEIIDGEKSNIPQIFLNENEVQSLNIILSIFSKLLSKNEFNSTFLNEDISGKNILEISSEYGEYNLFIELTKYIKNNNYILKNLIKPNKTNIFHLAADTNHVLSILYFFELYNNKIKYLNEKNLVGSTPLHLACYKGNYDIVNALIDLGCDLNIKDNEGRTPIFYSANKQIAIKLILNGAFKNIKDNKGRIPFDYINDDNIKESIRNKSLFEIFCLCKINYQSLKNQRKDILLFICLISVIVIQIFCKVRYQVSNYIIICLNNKSFFIENIFILSNIIFETITLIIVFLFHYLKGKNNKINYEEIDKINPKILDDLENDSISNGLYPKDESSLSINDTNENLNESLFEKYHKNSLICIRCKRDMKKNTQHCCACDKCIDDWDHHCFWLNICINDINKKYFYLFILFIILSVISNIISGILYLTDSFKYEFFYLGLFFNNTNCQGNLFFSILMIIILFLYCFIMLIILLSMIIPFLFS